MNLDDKQIRIENILKSDIFNHDKELANLDILFTKIENDN
jgi:hypothetical protein